MAAHVSLVHISATRHRIVGSGVNGGHPKTNKAESWENMLIEIYLHFRL